MATFKALALADQIAANLTLRLKGKGSAGADIAVSRSNSVIGGGTVVHPLILVGTQAAGADSNSATIAIVPEQMSSTGVASNVQVNGIGITQEVYSPHVAWLIAENLATAFTSWGVRMAILGELLSSGVKVEAYPTAAATAPTLAHKGSFDGSFVLDQFNPLTNQI